MVRCSVVTPTPVGNLPETQTTRSAQVRDAGVVDACHDQTNHVQKHLAHLRVGSIWLSMLALTDAARASGSDSLLQLYISIVCRLQHAVLSAQAKNITELEVGFLQLDQLLIYYVTKSFFCLRFASYEYVGFYARCRSVECLCRITEFYSLCQCCMTGILAHSYTELTSTTRCRWALRHVCSAACSRIKLASVQPYASPEPRPPPRARGGHALQNPEYRLPN